MIVHDSVRYVIDEGLVLLSEVEFDENLLLIVAWWDGKWLFLEVRLFTAFVRSWHLH
jgi:hypothetical protein